MKALQTFVYILLITFLPLMTLGHGGGLDSDGGHHNRKTGEYHYHRGIKSSSFWWKALIGGAVVYFLFRTRKGGVK